MEKTEKIWFNGSFVNWEDAKIHVLSHALHYGSGVFEGIRFYKTKNGRAIFRLKEHVDRLFTSAESLFMKIPYTKEEIFNAIKETVKINIAEEGYIRPIIFYGYGKMGINPEGAELNIAIAEWPWDSYLGDKPIKVKISDFIRIHPKSLKPDKKVTGHYVNSILANMDAKSKGYDESLLLDYNGNISEGPGENFFIVKNNVIKTTHLGGIIPGITRASIIEIAGNLGYPVTEGNILRKDLEDADEAFFTGTAAEVTLISLVDNKKFSSHEISSKLKNDYMDIVKGKNPKYVKWLTIVD